MALLLPSLYHKIDFLLLPSQSSSTDSNSPTGGGGKAGRLALLIGLPESGASRSALVKTFK